MENIRLKVLAGFKAGESASHLSKIYALSLDQVLEWKRLTIYGHTDWVDGNTALKKNERTRSCATASRVHFLHRRFF